MVTPIHFLSSAYVPTPIKRTAATNPFKAASPIVPLFGTTDNVQIRNRYVLVPEGTPFYMVHGTDSSSTRLSPLIHWFKQDVITKHPVFVSNMPEVTNSIGIEKSYGIMLRDIGDYRFQLLDKQLPKLKAAISKDPATIGSFFKLDPAHQKALVPIIQQYVIDPLYKVPEEWRPVFERPLAEKVEAVTNKLREELAPGKLRLKPEESELEIYDTHFLESKAGFVGKQRNYDTQVVDMGNDTVNMRRITLADACWMEAYLMMMEERMTPVLQQYFSQRSPQASDEDNHKLAKTTATKLLETLVPRIAMVGHSQGGIVAMYGLLKAYKTMPSSAEVLKSQKPRDFEALAARGIGLQIHLNSPLHGIPDRTAALKDIVKEVQDAVKDRKILRSANPIIEKTLKKILWYYFLRKGPAIEDMRADSEIIRFIRTNLPVLKEHNVSVISVFDRKDTFIEPAAAKLEALTKDTLPNVFNLELESRPQASIDGLPDETWFTFRNPQIASLIKILPKKVQSLIIGRLEKIQQQHSALVTFPAEVSQMVGETLIGDPQNQQKVLQTNNFEPFRYQSLVARSKSYRHRILEKPLPEAMAALEQFSKQYPGFFQALIENARENLPFINTASHQAMAILNHTLNLAEKAVADEKIKQQYRHILKEKLEVLAKADVPTPSAPGISNRARKLLQTLQ